MKRYSFIKGLTLIELLISMGIIVLLLAAGIPAYSSFKASNDLEQAAEDVKSAILETQNLAMAPDEGKSQTIKALSQVGYGESKNADSYLFFSGRGAWWSCGTFCTKYACAGPSNQYQIYLASSASKGYPTDTSVKSYMLPSGITVSCAVIQYSISQGGKIIYPTSGDITITVANSKGTKTVKVNQQTGQVTIQTVQ